MEINIKIKNLKDRPKKREKVNNWDVILITSGMIFGFIVIVMNITGIWPCNILNAIQTSNNENGFLEYFTGWAGWLHQLFRCS